MFGKIKFYGNDTDWEAQRFDRLAVDADNRLLFLSVVADAGIVKGIRGALNSENKRLSIGLDEVILSRPSHPDQCRTPTFTNRADCGYLSDTHRLGLNTVHAFFWVKSFGFMLDTSDAHLWRELRDTRYTTPLLREWLPWVKAQLLLREHIKEAYCFNCNCGVLNLATPKLDEIVSEGVRTGALPIPERAA